MYKSLIDERKMCRGSPFLFSKMVPGDGTKLSIQQNWKQHTKKTMEDLMHAQDTDNRKHAIKIGYRLDLLCVFAHSPCHPVRKTK